jgi:hypothetical protein
MMGGGPAVKKKTEIEIDFVHHHPARGWIHPQHHPSRQAALSAAESTVSRIVN